MTASRAGALLKGLGALAALLAAVVGVPLLLEAVAGSPIPTAIPAWDGVWASLTARDDGTLLLGILKYAAWAGWALFVLSVVADIVTRVRGLPVPRLGPQQQLATQLVGAVLALAVSVPTALPANAAPGNLAASAGQPALAAIAHGGGNRTMANEQAVDSEDEQEFAEYRVRRGDCLWDIAWNELGEPERWPEIYEASRSVRQPDGRRLTDPDLIVTGWVLHIPEPNTADASERARPQPSTGQGPSSQEAASRSQRVITPFSSGLHAVPTSPSHFSSGLHATSSRLRTALSTPAADTVQQASTLEWCWRRALAQDDATGSLHRNWRERLRPKPD